MIRTKLYQLEFGWFSIPATVFVSRPGTLKRRGSGCLWRGDICPFHPRSLNEVSASVWAWVRYTVNAVVELRKACYVSRGTKFTVGQTDVTHKQNFVLVQTADKSGFPQTRGNLKGRYCSSSININQITDKSIGWKKFINKSSVRGSVKIELCCNFLQNKPQTYFNRKRCRYKLTQQSASIRLASDTRLYNRSLAVALSWYVSKVDRNINYFNLRSFPRRSQNAMSWFEVVVPKLVRAVSQIKVAIMFCFPQHLIMIAHDAEQHCGFGSALPLEESHITPGVIG